MFKIIHCQKATRFYHAYTARVEFCKDLDDLLRIVEGADMTSVRIIFHRWNDHSHENTAPAEYYREYYQPFGL
jgi:hypothetical protein